MLSSQQFANAERLANEVLQVDSASPVALLIAGEAAIRQSRDEDAIRYFQRIEDDGSAETVCALYKAGERLMATGRAREAEQYLRRALRYDPGHPKANEKLALLLQIQGRTWESVPFARRLLIDGNFGKTQAVILGAVDTTFVEDFQFVENCLESEPGNSAILLGRARQELTMSRLDTAEKMIRPIVDEQPDFVEAQARLGRILVERIAEDEFLKWRRELPREAEAHPEIWYVQGLWARRNGQTQAAIRCFLEAAAKDPNHRGAVFQLSQLLTNTEHKQLAEQLAVRAQRLSQMHYLLMEIRFGYEVELVCKVIELLDALDRPLEAASWCYILQQWNLGREAWAKAEELRLIKRLSSDGALTLPSGHLVANVDRSTYPLPHWPSSARNVAESESESLIDGDIRFADVAASVGLDFTYFNGTKANVGLEHILQATGGGVGVIDFDQDGWPELYFIQIGPFPIDTNQTM